MPAAWEDDYWARGMETLDTDSLEERRDELQGHPRLLGDDDMLSELADIEAELAERKAKFGLGIDDCERYAD